MSETFSINEAAALLRVSRRAIYYWIASGYLAVEIVPWGTHHRKRVRADSIAFRVKPAYRRKVDARLGTTRSVA